MYASLVFAFGLVGVQPSVTIDATDQTKGAASDNPTGTDAPNEGSPPVETPAASAEAGLQDKKDAELKECKVVIMNLAMLGVPDDQQYVAQILTDTMAAEINSMGQCEVVTQADVAQMMDFEATKQLTCADDTASCIAEIGGALGVERVISGSIGLLGSSYKVQIKLHNVAEGRVEGRYDKMIRGDAELLDQAAREAGRQLFSKPNNGSGTISHEAPNAANESTPTDAASPSPSPTSTTSTDTDTIQETGSGLSSILMGVGAVGMVIGIASFAGSGLALAGAAYATETSGSVNVVPNDLKVWAAPTAYVSLVGLAAGSGITGVGGTMAAASLFLE